MAEEIHLFQHNHHLKLDAGVFPRRRGISGKALKDLNTLPVSERKNESFSKGDFTKPCNENLNENFDNGQRKKPVSLVSNDTGGEVGTVEVEYIESENLKDIEDSDLALNTILAGLESKEWVTVCESLNNIRRLSIFHKDAMFDKLENVISLLVKCLKNPRSAVCKTALMTVEDIFTAYGDDTIGSLDPLLLQLLLKSSQDKRFVCEAAEKALVAMTSWVSPSLLLPKLQSYLKHKNPKVRAKTSMCFCRCVPQLGTEGIKGYGIDKLVLVAAAQLSDQLPESREAARKLIVELQTEYETHHMNLLPPLPETDSWELFCQSKLSPLSAQAVLRVTNIAS